MSTEGIRSIKQHLEEEMEYCPPDEANDAAWDRAVFNAEEARRRYDRILNARMERLERRFNNWVQTHPYNEDFDITEGGITYP